MSRAWRFVIFSLLAGSTFLALAFAQGQTQPGAKPKIEIVNRLPVAKRKEIYTALVAAGRQAYDDAERKYPVEFQNVPTDRLANYGWEAEVLRRAKEQHRLEKQYEVEVFKKYGVSSVEAHAIGIEGLSRRWSRPAPK
jgi:hypothetical protein